jgi:hypothetical protein
MNSCPACSGRHPDDPPSRRICECGTNWTSPRKDFPMSAAADFFKWREDWLQFIPVRNKHGNWAVAIIIDDGYGDLADALHNCEDYQRKVEKACAEDGLPLGVPLNPVTLRPQVVDGAVVEEIE